MVEYPPLYHFNCHYTHNDQDNDGYFYAINEPRVMDNSLNATT
jgi:hypothetical protein